MNSVLTFIKESVEEVRTKITWSKFDELQKSSTLVLIASFIFAVVIGIVDFAFKNGLTWFYNSF